MPNWCQNNIRVEGKGHVVKHFILENFRTNDYGQNKLYELDFEKYDPTPIDEKTGDVIEDWYRWRLEHWGCKWSPVGQDQYVGLDIQDSDGNEESLDIHVANENGRWFDEKTILELEDDNIMKLTLQIGCDTPWGPPIAIFEQWYKQYRGTGIEIEMKFYEPGCEVLGEVSFNDDNTDGYYEKWLDHIYDKEGIQYLLQEGWEHRDWYNEECREYIEEMQPPEVAEKLIPEVVKRLESGTTEEAATLIADIFENYFKWLQGDDKESESSEK